MNTGTPKRKLVKIEVPIEDAMRVLAELRDKQKANTETGTYLTKEIGRIETAIANAQKQNDS